MATCSIISRPETACAFTITINLEQLECSVAILKNVKSSKMGRKDIMKIDSLIDLDFDILGYIDPGITINIIENDAIVAQTGAVPARKADQRHQVPESALHHHHRAGAGPRIQADRPGKPRLPLHVLRSEGQKGRLTQKDAQFMHNIR